jgi:hypothetical protein
MSDTKPSSANPGHRESSEAEAHPTKRQTWRLAKGEPEIPGVFFDEQFFPLARQEVLGLGFQEGLLGASYADRAFGFPSWQESLSPRLTRFFQTKRVRSRFGLCRSSPWPGLMRARE